MVAITYKIAPHNINPEAVWWVSIIGISLFLLWLWRDKEQAHQPDKAQVTDTKSTKRSTFEQVLLWVVGFLVFLVIVLVLGTAGS